MHADINECELDTDNNCDENAVCRNTIGGFNCTCVPGYKSYGILCTGKSLLPYNDILTQYIVQMSSLKLVCLYSTCSLSCFITPRNAFAYTDIDECTNGTDDCHNYATCNNTMGSFECTCNEGYAGDGETCVGEYENYCQLHSTKSSFIVVY